MRRHLAYGFLIVGVLAAGLGYLMYTRAEYLLAPLASVEGQRIDELLRLQFFLIALIFSLVVGLTLYAVFAFRRRPGEEGEGVYIHGWMPLEVGWTIVPLAIVLWLSALGARDFYWMRRPDHDMVVQVEAFRFGWTFTYPEYGIQSGELVLPVGKRVRFDITSRDVIHSFWVVEFRIKEDAVPGLVTHAYITPSRTGEFKVRCAEICGGGHAVMRAPVRVVTEEEFQAWVMENQAPSSPEAKGYQLVKQYCTACHSLDGSQLVGPTFQGIFGREVQLQDGSFITVDEAYIRESIRNPQARIVAGYPPSMPAYTPDQLSDEDVDAIIAFLKAFSEGTFQPSP